MTKVCELPINVVTFNVLTAELKRVYEGRQMTAIGAKRPMPVHPRALRRCGISRTGRTLRVRPYVRLCR